MITVHPFTGNKMGIFDKYSPDELRQKIQGEWKHFVFKRVKNVIFRDVPNAKKNILSILAHAPDGSAFPIEVSDLDDTVEKYRMASMKATGMGDKALNQYVKWLKDFIESVEIRAESFMGTTDDIILKKKYSRGEEICAPENECCRDTNKSIFFSSDNYYDLDFASEDPSFTFLENINSYSKGYLVPKVGELLCGIVEVNPKSGSRRYTKWTVVSEQFFRTWSQIQHGNGYLCTRIAGLDTVRGLLKGNRLIPNTFKKKLNSLDQRIKFVEEELECLADKIPQWIGLACEDAGKDVFNLIATKGAQRKQLLAERKEVLQTNFKPLSYEKDGRDYPHIYVRLIAYTLYSKEQGKMPIDIREDVDHILPDSYCCNNFCT